MTVCRPWLLRLLALLLVSLVLSRSRAEPAPTLSYVERVVGGQSARPLPLLIALHGLGDTPESFIELFAELDLPMRVVAPRAPDPYMVGSSWFAIDDPSRAPQGIVRRAELLVQLVEQLKKTRAVAGLPIVTGFSQGGVLSFALAAYHSQHFAAAMPIAGALPEGLPPFRPARKDFRVIALHGEQDARIPYRGAERTAAQLRAAGTNVSLTGFPGVAHSVPPAMRKRFYAALREQLKRVTP